MIIKRVLFIIMDFGTSGGLRVITRLANELSEKGVDVTIVSAYENEPYFPVIESVKIQRFIDVDHKKARKLLRKWICKYVDKYDAIVGTHWKTFYYLFYASIKHLTTKKNIYYIQAYEPDFSNKYTLNRLLARITYLLPSKQIVNSNIYRHYNEIRTNRVVPPGLDLKTYYPKDIATFNSIIKIGTIGRKEEWKGTADVCKAIELLSSNGVEIEFYIAFNDYDTIPHTFVKPDGDDNLAHFYREMDIVIAACKEQHGGIHYPIIEAMAVGTSVICTDYYPSTDENSYKVSDSSPEQISDAVREIIQNREMAIKKRQKALEDIQQFSWSVVAQKFLEYLQEGK